MVNIVIMKLQFVKCLQVWRCEWKPMTFYRREAGMFLFTVQTFHLDFTLSNLVCYLVQLKNKANKTYFPV